MLLGAHMSIAGGIFNAFERSYNIWWNSLQIFGKSPRGRKFAKSKIDDEDIAKARKYKQKFDQKWWVIHSVYLINLAKNYKDAKKSIDSVVDDFWLAGQLGLDAVNTHLGKTVGLSRDKAIENMVSNMWYIFDEIKDMSVKFLFENTAWQGTEIGYKFEEFGKLYSKLENKYWKSFVSEKVGICIDTAHGRGAGYDWNDLEGVLDEIDEYLWTDKIGLLHLNDTKAIIDSNLDRHASLGYGFIGLPSIAKLVKYWSKQNIPMILETPNSDIWKKEIEMLKGIIEWKFNDTQIKNFHNKNFKTQYLKKFEANVKAKSLFD